MRFQEGHGLGDTFQPTCPVMCEGPELWGPHAAGVGGPPRPAVIPLPPCFTPSLSCCALSILLGPPPWSTGPTRWSHFLRLIWVLLTAWRPAAQVHPVCLTVHSLSAMLAGALQLRPDPASPTRARAPPSSPWCSTKCSKGSRETFGGWRAFLLQGHPTRDCGRRGSAASAVRVQQAL